MNLLRSAEVAGGSAHQYRAEEECIAGVDEVKPQIWEYARGMS